ncbi:glycogen debranching N-terminal domain-containing protein [Dictyobacter aurantiacus]|uniref:Amylo-alpha-1,6-glucosidase n=1 Tax=Dictyobacter aurantiacus TaxID=1936993 RepID=A0A401ZMU8_9CHLR|nr:glycogen debranching N-terminal domain-containing protein [Dictyobacter aurantiacus]GCE08188.1 amylo-alpha-1,6-glucosidase [Dictyobacter aurantiacus]
MIEMASNTADFFEQIANMGSNEWLRGIKGTCHFDIDGFGSRYLTIDDGQLTLSESTDKVDAVIMGDVTNFDLVATGKYNLLTAYMRQLFTCKGSVALLFAVQRLFPPPASIEQDLNPDEEQFEEESDPVTPPIPAYDEKSPPTTTQTVSMISGSTFVVSDARGDIDASPTNTQGLFSTDTRFLSRWRLTINGVFPRGLATDDMQYHSMSFFLAPTTGTVYVDAALSVIRTRTIGHGFHEQLRILSHSNRPVDLNVRIEVGADFADIFEIKDALQKKGSYSHQIEEHRLILRYQRESFVREAWITCNQPCRITSDAISFEVHIEPHESWTAEIDVVVAKAGIEEHTVPMEGDARAEMRRDLDDWLAVAPDLRCEWPELDRIYRQSMVDLASLRFYLKSLPGQALPAAGLPWFMAVFGRDSLITSFQALPFAPELAITTLRNLAYRQGCYVDDFRDEEPGKIIHESRFGEMTAFEERPHSPYYGSADATPLFLILLDEVERWTGNTELVMQLEHNARAALDWIDTYGDLNGDGYVEYNRRNKKTGMVNQCWKDSWNSILFADGTNSRLPRTLCEIQGYVYDAKKRCARLARDFWGDPTFAAKLEREANELKERFNRDFWLEDKGYFALAIDGQGRKVDSLTSNIGHLLWSGIVEDDKIESCVRHLMGHRLFSGWGVRTMAEGDGGYNPIGYHNGTIWPHDNSLIAYGLARNGYKKEANQIAMGILQAATYFNYRLPEAFAGYERSMTDYPVEYPTACSPQAWATAAPLLLLRTILGLEPIDDHLLVNPYLPEDLQELMIFNIPGRWGRVDAFGRSKSNDRPLRRGPLSR